MIKLEKMHISTIENPHNFGTYWMIEISLVLCSVHMVPRDQNKFMFYVNNYINYNHFN